MIRDVDFCLYSEMHGWWIWGARFVEMFEVDLDDIFIALEQLWNTTQHDDNSNETFRLWLCCQLCDNSFKLQHLRQITCAFQGLLDFAFVFGSVQALFSHGLHLLGFFWKKWN